MKSVDVIILGAGPAGLSAAQRLVSLGYHPVVIAAPSSRTRRQLETVPHLEIITHAFPGLELEAPVLVEAQRVGVSWWTGEATTTRSVSVVDRGCANSPGLDAQLLNHCLRSGVTVHRIERGAAKLSFDDGWQLNSPEIDLRSRFVIDATGRHSSLHHRTPLVPWRHVVISAELRLKADTPALWTESLPDGWLWAIRDLSNKWLVSLFLDSSSLREDRQRVWRRSLSQSRLSSQIEAFGHPSLSVQEATPAATDTVFSRGMIHLGDAALARCPLASQGLSAAISDGQSAAIALHNLMRGTVTEPVVREFLETRHLQSVQRHVKFLAASYDASPYDSPYWQARGAASAQKDPVPIHSLDQLVTLSPDWQLRPHPTLDGDSIRVAPCLCSDEETLRWVAGYSVADLLAPLLTSAHFTFRALLHSWAASNLVAEQRAMQVLSWLTQRSVLVPA